MPLISVVVPVYNVEKYLNKCIDSILSCKFDDYELILVDDGSPDSCGSICDYYADKNHNIKVVHKENGGSASARNSGLKIANGEFIVFCDSDDYYDSEYLEKLFMYIHDNKHSDTLIAFNYVNVWLNSIDSKIIYKEKKISFSTSSDRINFLSTSTSHRSIGYAIWDKVYSKKIIEKYGIEFLERDIMNNRDDWSEDLLFNLHYLLHIDNIQVLELPVYMLRKHGDINEQNEDALLNRFTHMMKFFNEIKIKTRDDFIRLNFWKIIIWHMYRYIYVDLSRKDIITLRKEYIKDDFWEMFLECIELALDNWDEYSKNRWNKLVSKEYKNILKYLKDGNYTLYKFKNYFIWKIYCKICRM